MTQNPGLLLRANRGITMTPLGLRIARSALAAFAGVHHGPAELDLRTRADGVSAVRTGAVLRLKVLLRPRRFSAMSTADMDALFCGLAARAAAAPVITAPCPGARVPLRRPAVLLFRSLLNSREKDASAMHQASWYLASALGAAGCRVVFSDLKLDPAGAGVEDAEELRALLRAETDLDFAALTVSETYFKGASELARIIKRASPGCRVAVGGIMPSSHPFHVLAGLPGADLLVRGDGEEVFPRAVSLLCGRLDAAAELALLGLGGLAWRDGERLILSGIGEVNRVADLDAGQLDFGLLSRRDVAAGGAMYLSRGCLNACSFCVSSGKRAFRGVSPRKADGWFAAYSGRLRELYGREIPGAALGLGFYDDDFLADKERALALLRSVRRRGLFVSYLQTGIRSFFTRGRLDAGFIKALDPAFFRPAVPAAREKTDMFIGTENFSGRELRTLGKGYGIAEVRAVAAALSARGIRQNHHLILSNVRTKAADLRANLREVASLRRRFAPFFGLLRPVTPALFTFFGTPTWRREQGGALSKYLNMSAGIAIPGFPEFDYPLAGGDRPADKAAAALVRGAAGALERL